MPGFNFAIPKVIEGVDSQVLNPERAWKNPAAFKEQTKVLIAQFIENFKKFAAPAAIQAAGPVEEAVSIV